MRRLIHNQTFIILLATMFFFSCSPIDKKNSTAISIQQVTDSLKSIYAPDKRVAVFTTKIETDEHNQVIVQLVTDNPNAKTDLEKIISEQFPAVSFSSHLYPDTSLQGKHYGIINVSVANIKSKAAHSAELASQTILGTAVKLLTIDDPWILAQTPDNYLGWIHSSSIQKCTKEGLNAWIEAKKIVYTNHAGFVFKTEKMKQPISDITAGSILKLAGETAMHYKVTFPDQRIGFIYKKEAQEFNQWMQSHTYEPDAIIDRAMQFLGHPYLWGGTSSKAVDCSGFTKTVYFMNGIVLQRDASQQELYGEKISLDNNFAALKPGDLLFFGRAQTDSTRKKITHVGIYAGNLNFIHASGRVHYDSFNPETENYNEYRHKTVVSARRILNSVNTTGIEKVTDNTFYQTQH